jgi:hypothetical protein
MGLDILAESIRNSCKEGPCTRTQRQRANSHGGWNHRLLGVDALLLLQAEGREGEPFRWYGR